MWGATMTLFDTTLMAQLRVITPRGIQYFNIHILQHVIHILSLPRYTLARIVYYIIKYLYNVVATWPRISNSGWSQWGMSEQQQCIPVGSLVYMHLQCTCTLICWIPANLRLRDNKNGAACERISYSWMYMCELFDAIFWLNYMFSLHHNFLISTKTLSSYKANCFHLFL